MEVIEFPRMKKADDTAQKLTELLVIECQKLGIDTMNQDFAFDMAWTHKFIKATIDKQYNIANDLCRLTRAQGLDES
jgi:hypothetical protein